MKTKISTDINYPNALFPKSMRSSMLEDDLKEENKMLKEALQEIETLSANSGGNFRLPEIFKIAQRVLKRDGK